MVFVVYLCLASCAPDARVPGTHILLLQYIISLCIFVSSVVILGGIVPFILPISYHPSKDHRPAQMDIAMSPGLDVDPLNPVWRVSVLPREPTTWANIIINRAGYPTNLGSRRANKHKKCSDYSSPNINTWFCLAITTAQTP